MKLNLKMTVEVEATHIEVEADPRYWEDATVNGVEDLDGTLIPFRRDGLWCPKIRLRDGLMEGWPHGVTADIRYKVCDECRYFLVDETGARVARYDGDYVPDDILAVGGRGFGDYIILVVNAWTAFGLPAPRRDGGWTRGLCGGWSCHVEQGRYGHPAKKATWLYAFGVELADLRWGHIPDGQSTALVSWCGNDVSSGEVRPRVGKKVASATPIEFAHELIAMARSVKPQSRG